MNISAISRVIARSTLVLCACLIVLLGIGCKRIMGSYIINDFAKAIAFVEKWRQEHGSLPGVVEFSLWHQSHPSPIVQYYYEACSNRACSCAYKIVYCASEGEILYTSNDKMLWIGGYDTNVVHRVLFDDLLRRRWGVDGHGRILYREQAFPNSDALWFDFPKRSE